LNLQATLGDCRPPSRRFVAVQTRPDRNLSPSSLRDPKFAPGHLPPPFGNNIADICPWLELGFEVMWLLFRVTVEVIRVWFRIIRVRVRR